MPKERKEMDEMKEDISNYVERGDFDSTTYKRILKTGTKLLNKIEALPRQKASHLLDDIVVEYTMDRFLSELNDTEDAQEQEEIISMAEREAAQINNDGTAAQVAFILADAGVEYGAHVINQAMTK